MEYIAPGTRRVRRGRRGGLKDMPHMPMDILIEIFSFMHPRDLLNLARTTKDFRAFLMSRTSAPFWKAARSQVDNLPDCPPYLSEPAYASLLFFPHCHICLRSNIQNILFEFSARYCRDCQRYMLVEDIDVTDILYQIQQEADVEEPFMNTVVITKKSEAKGYYHQPEYEELLQTWHSGRPIAEKRQYLLEKVAIVTLVEQSCPELYDWKEDLVQNRAEELDRLREERLSTILDFLRRDGWGEELVRMGQDDLDALADQPYSRKPQKLTRRAWEGIREDANAFMVDVQAERLRQERISLIWDRLRNFGVILADLDLISFARTPEWELKPHFEDLALLPAFQAILNHPSDAQVDDEAATFSHNNINALVEQWQNNNKEILILKLRDAVDLPDDIQNPLDLAIAIFTCGCSWRNGALWYPDLLAHEPCVRPHVWSHRDDYSDIVSRITKALGARSAINLDNLRVDKTMVDDMRAIVEAYGLDPLRATRQDLERCKTRLYCARNRCHTEQCFRDPPERNRIIVQGCDWIRAFEHSRAVHRDSIRGRARWKTLRSAGAARVRVAEDRVRAFPDSVKDHLRCCVNCLYSTLNRDNIRRHLEDSHDIVASEEELDQYFYVRPDKPWRGLPKIFVRYYEVDDYATFDVKLEERWRNIT